jgi:hypothetical protein
MGVGPWLYPFLVVSSRRGGGPPRAPAAVAIDWLASTAKFSLLTIERFGQRGRDIQVDLAVYAFAFDALQGRGIAHTADL